MYVTNLVADIESPFSLIIHVPTATLRFIYSVSPSNLPITLRRRSQVVVIARSIHHVSHSSLCLCVKSNLKHANDTALCLLNRFFFNKHQVFLSSQGTDLPHHNLQVYTRGQTKQTSKRTVQQSVNESPVVLHKRAPSKSLRTPQEVCVGLDTDITHKIFAAGHVELRAAYCTQVQQQK